MTTFNTAEEALARYRDLQDSEGATLDDEFRITRAAGEAWRAFVALRDADPYINEASANPERAGNGCMIYRGAE